MSKKQVIIFWIGIILSIAIGVAGYFFFPKWFVDFSESWKYGNIFWFALAAWGALLIFTIIFVILNNKKSENGKEK